MGTRSSIGIQNEDSSVTAIYCHWDGYPSHNGRILSNHYANEDKVRALIALGDISSLAEEIGEQHPFNTWHLKKEEMDPRWEKWTTAYGRDRGETDVKARDYVSPADYFSRFDAGIEYAYLFAEGKWLVQPTYGKMTWVPVDNYLLEEAAE
jgi:hypothetical protein